MHADVHQSLLRALALQNVVPPLYRVAYRPLHIAQVLSHLHQLVGCIFEFRHVEVLAQLHFLPRGDLRNRQRPNGFRNVEIWHFVLIFSPQLPVEELQQVLHFEQIDHGNQVNFKNLGFGFCDGLGYSSKRSLVIIVY